MKVFLLEFDGYREWTESLGYDREWKIQDIQHEIVKLANLIASDYGGFVLSSRYDYLTVIADGIKNESLMHLYKEIASISPTKVKYCLGYGKTPLEAQRDAYNCLKHDFSNRIIELPDEEIVACHFDIDNFTKITFSTSAYDALTYFSDIYYSLSRYIYDIGGLTQYLGGDNFIAFINYENINKVLEISTKTENIKVGIGIGKNARLAMAKATEALDTIRKTRDKKWLILSSMPEWHY